VTSTENRRVTPSANPPYALCFKKRAVSVFKNHFSCELLMPSLSSGNREINFRQNVKINFSYQIRESGKDGIFHVRLAKMLGDIKRQVQLLNQDVERFHQKPGISNVHGRSPSVAKTSIR
jgi:hypothetical protein